MDSDRVLKKFDGIRSDYTEARIAAAVGPNWRAYDDLELDKVQDITDEVMDMLLGIKRRV
tara:strand:- start:1628 stop:1807 length:180 start_codon:yes stop_codon:yes gene_type:complete